MNAKIFSLGQVLQNAHENPERAANILARRMAQRAIKIAQENPKPPMSNGSSITTVSRLALAHIQPHTLATHLIPIARDLINNHGAGHKVHDMDTHFWELGNDSALELICECLRKNGLDQVAEYISEKTIRRHVLHDSARLSLLDAGYTYNSALSGGHHGVDSFWKGHNTQSETANKQTITSALYLREDGTVLPLIEGDRIEERSQGIFCVTGDTITLYTRPKKKQYPKTINTVGADGNVDPDLYHEAIESRNTIRDPENMVTEAVVSEILTIQDIGMGDLNIDNGEKIRYTPWTIYTITKGEKSIFVHVNENNISESFFAETKKHENTK